MNEFVRKQEVGYIWILYYRRVAVYVGMGRSFNNDLAGSLGKKRFDGMKYYEVPVGRMLEEKRAMIKKLDPVYNKAKKKRLPAKELTLQEKLDYCRDKGISLADYNKV